MYARSADACLDQRSHASELLNPRHKVETSYAELSSTKSCNAAGIAFLPLALCSPLPAWCTSSLLIAASRTADAQRELKQRT